MPTAYSLDRRALHRDCNDRKDTPEMITVRTINYKGDEIDKRLFLSIHDAALYAQDLRDCIEKAKTDWTRRDGGCLSDTLDFTTLEMVIITADLQ
jgi:hypothetical protein